VSVEADCRPSPDGWACDVEVADDAGRTRHAVTVRPEDLARLDPTAADPTDLVRRSFDFLLRHEPKESILATFDLTVIARYFPDYEAEIRRRV
jgi:hypothetical protein